MAAKRKAPNKRAKSSVPGGSARSGGHQADPSELTPSPEPESKGPVDCSVHGPACPGGHRPKSQRK